MDDRAVSEVLSYVLVFTLILASIAVVSVSGLGTLRSARDATQINNAERAFDVLADNMADVYERAAPSRATEINVGSASLYTGENVTINVTARDADTPERIDASVERTTRPLIFRGEGGAKLVYVGGMVFRQDRGGGIVLNRAPVVARSDRVYVPVLGLRTNGTRSFSGSTVLVRANERRSNVPIADTAGRYENVTVNVTSPRASLWRSALSDAGFDCFNERTTSPRRVACRVQTGGGIPAVYVSTHRIVVDVEG
ncbi:MAG: hypothetical protein ABEJ89_05435 [Haloarculaceae archaeon]